MSFNECPPGYDPELWEAAMKSMQSETDSAPVSVSIETNNGGLLGVILSLANLCRSTNSGDLAEGVELIDEKDDHWHLRNSGARPETVGKLDLKTESHVQIDGGNQVIPKNQIDHEKGFWKWIRYTFRITDDHSHPVNSDGRTENHGVHARQPRQNHPQADTNQCRLRRVSRDARQHRRTKRSVEYWEGE